MSLTVAVILIFAAAVVFAIAGFFAGQAYRKKVSEAKLGSADEEANRIVTDAVNKAETIKKEKILEANDEIHKQRNELESEIRERRAEAQRLEKRINQKEDSLDKRTQQIEKREETLSKKIKTADERLAEVEALKKSQYDMLEKISGYTKEEAKDHIIKSIEAEITHEKAVKIRELESAFHDEADNMAREIVSTAIGRCAAEYTSEITVSVVNLPNEEMKGRIIGREGRNIRSIETVTGADLIIDDTPETITVSCFDPVRREIARLTLEKLIADGRIHPANIESTYKKAKAEIEKKIKQAGDQAVLESGVNGLHPELVKLLGALKYRTSYGQNVLNHSLEVSNIAGILASEIGADVKACRRAGLLHDIGKALDRQTDGSHVELGVEVCRKYKENETIIHAIQAHHGDVEAKTVVAVLVQAADAISAGRPGARSDNVENYVKRLQSLEQIANSFNGVEKTYAIQAGREIRILVKPEAVPDDQMTLMARDIAKKIEEELEYPGQIKVNLVRESRVVDFAK